MGNVKVTHPLDLDLDGRVILKWILEKLIVDCIYLVQDRIQWWALVNTVINFYSSIKGIFLQLNDCWFLKKDSAATSLCKLCISSHYGLLEFCDASGLCKELFNLELKCHDRNAGFTTVLRGYENSEMVKFN
jgi:hypothetical protein